MTSQVGEIEQRKGFRRGAWISSAIAAGLLTSCALNPFPARIGAYRGDGEISRIRFLPNQGLKIDFEEFSLAAPYRAVYRLNGLPKHRSGYTIGLIAYTGSNEQRPPELTGRPGGTLSVRVLDGRGRTILECAATIDRLGWGYEAGDRMGEIHNTKSDGSFEHSYLAPAEFRRPPDVPTTLEVSYEPSSDAPDIRARIRLSAGGFT